MVTVTTIGFDFEFEDLSLRMAEFITDALTSYPEGKIEDVSNHYRPTADVRYLHFSASEEVATLLKLKYGNHIRKRPAREPDYDELNNIKRKYFFDKNNYIERICPDPI